MSHRLAAAVAAAVALCLSGCSGEPPKSPAAQPTPEATAAEATQAEATPAPFALREVQPAEVVRGELTSVAILGSSFPDDPSSLTLAFRTEGGDDVAVPFDAVSFGQEIMLLDRKFEELTTGTHTIILRFGEAEAQLPGFVVR